MYYCEVVINANLCIQTQTTMKTTTTNKKLYSCTCMSLRTILVLCIITSELPMLSHASEVSSVYSCPISPLTVQEVENCPDSKEKWQEAAARKNCAAYASQCDEPERLVYHCVINSFINATLEVCAYAQFIVFGHCTDYSISGNLIKQNWGTNCEVFETKPCPNVYRSTEAYKYPGCYELTKNSKRSTTKFEFEISSTRGIPSDKKTKLLHKGDANIVIWAASIAFFSSFLFLIISVFFAIFLKIAADETISRCLLYWIV